jgi:hypothetical protein
MMAGRCRRPDPHQQSIAGLKLPQIDMPQAAINGLWQSSMV